MGHVMGNYAGNLDHFATLLAFDMFSAVCLGTVFESANESVVDPKNSKFIADAQEAFSLIGQMRFVQPEERTTHPLWFKFVVAMDDTQERAAQLVTEVMDALDSGTANDLQKDSYAAKLLERDELTKEEIVQTLMVLLQAGVDTTATVINWLLINLASNVEAQNKLREEVLSICPSGDITEDHLKEMTYLKACIRESHRLTPGLTLGTARPAPRDLEMSGYEIPEGTLIVTNTHCIQNDPNLVEHVDKFMPERWSKSAVEARKGTAQGICDHALLRDSFGMGARSCLGQRVAKLEIQVAMARLIRDWRLEMPHGQSWEVNATFLTKAEPFPEFRMSPVA